MARINRDTIAGGILLAFSLILAFYLTPDQVEYRANVPAALSARLFCYITAGLLGMLSLVLIIMSLRKNGQTAAAQGAHTSWEPIIRGALCTVVSAVYVALSSVLGFFTSTALAMIVFLLYFGVKKWTGILLFLVIILGFIYLLFVEALKVAMPDGLFF